MDDVYKKESVHQKQITISTLGSCVTRDIFRICDNEKEFKLQGNLGFISPISLFSDGFENEEIVKLINKSAAATFEKRNATLDLTGKTWEFITSNKSEYLLFDIGDICFPILRKGNCSVTLRNTKPEGIVLEKELLARGFERVDLSTFSIDQILSYIDELCQKISSIWEKEKIIFLACKPITNILNPNKEIVQSKKMDQFYIDMHPEIFSIVIHYIINKLECNIVKMPKLQFVLANACHTWGLHPLHYTDIVYEYFFEQIKSITMEDYVSEHLNVEEKLRFEYYRSHNKRVLTNAISNDYVKLVSTNSICAYLDILSKLEHCLIVISIKDTAGSYLTENVQSKLLSLGLIEDLKRKYMVGYIGIIKHNVVIHESKSILGGKEYYCDQINYCNLFVSSEPYNNGNTTSILINGVDYAVNARGLNIVVYDMEKEYVIDSVAFDTHVPKCICTRKSMIRDNVSELQVKVEMMYAKTNLLLDINEGERNGTRKK